MKSILPNLGRSQTAVLMISEALNFVFWKNFKIEKGPISHKLKIRTAQVVKMAFLGLQNDEN